MLLMIDNYDSFTFNLVQYFAELGEDVRVFRNDELSLQDIAALRPDKLVLSPGPCSPGRSGHLRPGDSAFHRQAADPGRVPWPPEHWCGAGRQGDPRAGADARQDQRDLDR